MLFFIYSFLYDIIVDNKNPKGLITINKRINFDKKYLKISIYIIVVLAFCIAFNKLLENFVPIASSIGLVFSYISNLVLPFIYGFFIAYFLNPLVAFFRNRLFSRIPHLNKKERFCRFLSILLTYVIVFGGIVWILCYIIPEILVNLSNIIGLLSKNGTIYELDMDLYSYLDYIPFIDPEMIQDSINSSIEPLINKLQDMPQLIETFVIGPLLAAKNIIKFLFGVLLAFYMLYEKESFLEQGKKIILALLPEKKSEFVLSNLRRINGVYANFIYGKAIDSLIIGIICFVGVTILKTPYGPLISIIIGITNIIPYFGPFLGAIPSIIIVFLVDPIAALVFTVFVLILQQFDGNILGPKILSGSVGLSPLWILFSITIGGSVGGILGMFLGVPTVAVIKMFISEAIDRKYKKRYPDDSKPVSDALITEEGE